MKRTMESEACVVLHMLEQLRQELTECVAVYAEPGSVEKANKESMTSPSNSTESRWSMIKDTMGIMLREAWKEQGKSGCHHPEVSEESSFSGTVTGWYLCTTCGHRMPHRTSAGGGPTPDAHPLAVGTGYSGGVEERGE